jgi:hypothetical protein
MGLKYSAILASALLVCLGASHSQALTIAPLHQAADESPMIELVGGNGGSWSHGGGGGHGGMHGAGGGRHMMPPAWATHGPGWNAGMHGHGNGGGGHRNKNHVE